MGKIETNVGNNFLLLFNKLGRMFRNNRGVAIYRDKYGKITSRVRYGVGPNGFPDYIGWRSLVITQEMVGTTVAQFAGVEVKKPGDKPSKEQFERIDQVNAAGGIAGWADSPEMGMEIFE